MGSVLNSAGHRAVIARSEKIAIQSIQEGTFDAIVLSIEEIQAGCEFATRLRSLPATIDTPIIFLVNELSAKSSEMLANHGGVFSILKPVQPDSLVDLVEKALWLPHIARSHQNRGRSMERTAPTAYDWVTL
jgi:CheY-like chemotaxis protein